MSSRRWTAVIAAAVLVLGGRIARAEDSSAFLRVFLTDGTAVVSFGEPARVGERVVFSMPTAVGPSPTLHLVDLPSARVDWDRTSRYAATARATRYLDSQGALDYPALSNEGAATLAT